MVGLDEPSVDFNVTLDRVDRVKLDGFPDLRSLLRAIPASPSTLMIRFIRPFWTQMSWVEYMQNMCIFIKLVLYMFGLLTYGSCLPKTSLQAGMSRSLYSTYTTSALGWVWLQLKKEEFGRTWNSSAAVRLCPSAAGQSSSSLSSRQSSSPSQRHSDRKQPI